MYITVALYHEILTIYEVKSATVQKSSHPEHSALLRLCRRFGTCDRMRGTDLERYSYRFDPYECIWYETFTSRASRAGVLYYHDYSQIDDDRLRECFSRMILNRRRFHTLDPVSGGCEAYVADTVTALFENQLLYELKDATGWRDQGRALFKSKVDGYVKRKMAVRMCIPAFPCKSTNTDKVGSNLPDGAEYEALANLVSFCAKVRRVYNAGCEITIVSDGHVFSDCTGTDDDKVTEYNIHLKSMLEAVKVEASYHYNDIKFCDLEELMLDDHDQKCEVAEIFPEPIRAITHPVRTRVNQNNDLCRMFLVATCAPSRSIVEDLIKVAPGHAVTAIYRGFSRFMMQDLAFHPDMRRRTITQRKKLAEEAALEMIRRNQAYSRLIEILLPDHIRLSIHAHDNRGPKFAIRLLDFRSVISGLAITAADAVDTATTDLHIPTP